MVVLEQNSNNTFYLLVNNNYRLVSGVDEYEFRIIDDFNNKVKSVILEDISVTSLFLEFDITTTDDKSLEGPLLYVENGYIEDGYIESGELVYFVTDKRYRYELCIDNVIIDTNFLLVKN